MDSKVRELFAKISKENETDAGNAGERFAEEWFKKQSFRYLKIPQSKSTKPKELIERNAKRPDFELLTDNEEQVMFMADAKYHQTENCSSFTLSIDEINQYKAFKRWVLDECPDGSICEICFILFPKELNGERLVVIGLDEFESGVETVIGNEKKPALKIQLNDNNLWFDN